MGDFPTNEYFPCGRLPEEQITFIWAIFWVLKMGNGKKVLGDGRFSFKSKEWIQSQYTPRHTHETEKGQKTFVLRLVVVPVFTPPRISPFPFFRCDYLFGKGEEEEGSFILKRKEKFHF